MQNTNQTKEVKFSTVCAELNNRKKDKQLQTIFIFPSSFIRLFIIPVYRKLWCKLFYDLFSLFLLVYCGRQLIGLDSSSAF